MSIGQCERPNPELCTASHDIYKNVDCDFVV